MTPIFADSGYYVALLLQSDQTYMRAMEITRQLQAPIITTAWILTEVANTFSAPLKVEPVAASEPAESVNQLSELREIY